MSESFTEYQVRLMLEKIAGGIPKHPSIIEGWINAKNKNKSELQKTALVNATLEELPAMANEELAKSWCGFKSDEHGLYLESRNVIAMMKEGANVCKDIIKIKQMKAKLVERVFLVDRKVYLGGKKEPDGFDERPVSTWQGSALKRTDYVENCEIAFRIKILNDPGANKIPAKALKQVFEYGQDGGLGASRSQGYGQYQLLEFQEVEAA